MRAHQAASSASSAREKWTRPLVVGPSPVNTPSRTIVSARAEVLRQGGSGTPIASTGFSTLLDLADIITVTLLSSVSCSGRAPVNEWLTIRHRDLSISKWLLIGRIYSRTGSGATARGGTGVVEAIKGDIWAIPAFTDTVVFSPQPQGSKGDARGSLDKRMVYPFGIGPFTFPPSPAM